MVLHSQVFHIFERYFARSAHLSFASFFYELLRIKSIRIKITYSYKQVYWKHLLVWHADVDHVIYRHRLRHKVSAVSQSVKGNRARKRFRSTMSRLSPALSSLLWSYMARTDARIFACECKCIAHGRMRVSPGGIIAPLSVPLRDIMADFSLRYARTNKSHRALLRAIFTHRYLPYWRSPD